MQLISGQFVDIDEFCQSLQTWDTEFYPLSSTRMGDSAATITQAGRNDYEYMRVKFGSSLKMFGGSPKGFVTFNFMEPSTKRYWWRGHDLDSSMAWVFPVCGELQSISPAGFCVHTLSVTEERIEAIVSRNEIDLPSPSQRIETFHVPKRILQRILECLRTMSNKIRPFPQDLVGEILDLIVPLWISPHTMHRVKKPSLRARDMAVRRSLEFLEQCDLTELSLQRLLDQSHVSERTLDYAYRDRLGTSPAAFIKQYRLVKARAALRRAELGELTVGDIAAETGFSHLGQFSTDYRRAFGELPKETLRDLIRLPTSF